MPEALFHIVVVGGSSGLGKVVAQMYAGGGHHVSVVSRSRPALVDQAANVRHFAADLANLAADGAGELARDIAEAAGPISYVVFCQRCRGQDRNLANEMAVSVAATDLLIQALRPHFAKEGDRAILAVSSVYADFVGSSQPLSYHVAKAGLNALVRYYAVTLGQEGVRVNAMSPLTYLKDESKHIYLDNQQTLDKYRRLVPLGRMGTAAECAETIRFLCSRKSSFVTGQVLYVDGGVSAVWPEELA